MAKKFYTEKDIEDLVRGGVTSLAVGDDVVLTELAYEKASRLGMRLVRAQPDNPPSAPVRPYLAQKSMPQKPVPCACPPAGETGTDLAKRIREAVLGRMGNQVDPALLDVIIERVLKSTGVK